MNDFEARVREVYEALAERPLSDAEVADIALTLRQLAAFLTECGQDEGVRSSLGLAPRAAGVQQTSAAPRVVDNTTLAGGNPVREPRLVETDPQTASSPDASPHRDSSASTASASPAEQPTALPQPATTGATVDGFL